MRVYNTLTRKKEDFITLEEKKVKMYVCGPTVYDYIHLGNARPYVVFDTVRRYLESKGYTVDFVQNFTDVDDKIIMRANAESVPAKIIAERFIEAALTDAENLNTLPATIVPRVTLDMDCIIEMIDVLIKKGAAYAHGGTVYYDTSQYPAYGKLSRKNIDELEAGARVEVDENKRSAADFVLWKPYKPGEPKWTSPWGEGRPGWHIECSAMAKKYLGDTIDIHAGGEDLIFPHHENEIAQSEAANGVRFARYWLHNGHINIDNQKMSKSLGNFFTLREIAEKFPYEVIRFFILSIHYRSPINFSDVLLQSAENGLERIKNCGAHLRFVMHNTDRYEMTSEEHKILSGMDQFSLAFEDAMDEDFNTADAIAAIYDLVKYANLHITERSSQALTEATLARLEKLCAILGFSPERAPVDDREEIEAWIEKRHIARQNKDWAAADAIRDTLKQMGIVLEDTPTGVKYHRS